MATGITNIRIVTTTGLTLSDDTILPSGAVMKIAVEFPTTFQGFRFDVETYENQERFEAGDAPLQLKNFNSSGEFLLENRVPQINVYAVYYIAVDIINKQFDQPVCEIQVEYGEI